MERTGIMARPLIVVAALNFAATALVFSNLTSAWAYPLLAASMLNVLPVFYAIGICSVIFEALLFFEEGRDKDSRGFFGNLLAGTDRRRNAFRYAVVIVALVGMAWCMTRFAEPWGGELSQAPLLQTQGESDTSESLKRAD